MAKRNTYSNEVMANTLRSLETLIGNAAIEVGLNIGKDPHIHGHLAWARQELLQAAKLLEARSEVSKGVVPCC